MRILTGIDVLGNGSIGGKLTVGDTEVSSETITFDGSTGKGMRVENTYGYVNIAPLNSGWAHIYTDRTKFIFNQTVYTASNAFSSYTDDLLLQRGGLTKLTVGATDSVFGTGLKANDFKVGGATIIESDGKIDYNKLKNIPGLFDPKPHEHNVLYYTKTEIDRDLYKKSQLSTSGQSVLHWNNIIERPTFDNYEGWTLKTNSETTGLLMTAKSVVDIKGAGATNVSRIGGVITITSANDNNYLTGVSGSGNGVITFTRLGLANTTVNLAHTHTVAQTAGLQLALDAKETPGGAAAKVTAHSIEDEPHTYGGKFKIAFNPTFGTLDFKVVA